MGLSPIGQILVHYREALRQAEVLSMGEVKAAQAGQWVWVAGLVVVRQRPATDRGILFASLENETGLLDLVVKPAVYDQYRDLLRNAPLILVAGIVQRAGNAVNVLVHYAKWL